MGYFDEHNKKRAKKLAKIISAERIAHRERTIQGYYESNKSLIRKHKENKKEIQGIRKNGKRENLIFSIQLNKYIPYEDYLKKGTEFINREEVLGEEQAERIMGN